MQPFIHIDIASADEVIPLLDARTRPLAGGTDMLPLMKEGIVAPERLINLKRATNLRYIRVAGDGLHIGALTTLDDLDRHPDVRRDYTALAQAAAESASPQLRNMATIGGNILQQVRCWYYRGDFHCWLKGGQLCHARDGRNEYHAIIDQSPCVAVYPSDPPAALIALDARLRIVGPQGERLVAVADFLQPPSAEHRSIHSLAPNELIIEVHVPKPTASSRCSIYLKAMDRATWAYALLSVAVAADVSAASLRNVRIVLGAVANTPLRAPSAEALVEGQSLTEELLRQAGRAAVADAAPLEHNGYKLPLTRNLVAQALRELRDGPSS